jgi:molecular chaperone GrpE
MSSREESSTGPVIRDLRRIDPVTGQVRDSGPTPSGGGQRGQAKRPGRHAASRPGGAAGSPGTPGAGGSPAGSGGRGSGPQQGASGAAAPGPGAAKDGPPAGAPSPAPGKPGAGDAAALAERTADLQRVTAEYANYRKRVERDRVAVREQALSNVLASLLPVLDDIGRAREHGELTGGFKSVADSLEAITSKLGLQSFGESGEPFDPNVHEALMHSYSASVSEPTCVQILQPGYRVGERILRPARVAVAEPGDGGEDGEDGNGGDGTAAPSGPPEPDGN